MSKYANIIVDISLEKLDKTFQYAVPPEMQDELQEGMPVVIPFGNRKIRGYVLELTDAAEYDPAKIRPIIKIDQDKTVVQSHMIALAAWMKRNYGATMNQALKTVIPIKQKTGVKEKKILHLRISETEAKEQLAEYVRKHNTARARLLEALLESKSLESEFVTNKLNVSTAVIRALEEQCILSIEKVREYRNPVQGIVKQDVPLQLNAQQQKVVQDIIQNAESQMPRPVLLHGVTGSGKTEVYMELIASAIAKGQQSIVLIPEIALTYQTVMRFYRRFGDRVSILNSKMSQGERFDQFERVARGEVDVMIGPRSALFTPFTNLGYIIIDEEHEGTYKSETMPRYHARETAIRRAQMEGAVVVLGSATPSLESYSRALEGEYLLEEMNQRVCEKPLPTCYVQDLRVELKEGNKSILSRKLQELMQDRLEKGQQTMLFLNRRGLSAFVSCRACGYVVKCPHCDVSLSLHNNGKMVCHYCGYEQPMVKNCPDCGSTYISGFKTGTQKVEQIVQKHFPSARILRMDFDTTRNKEGHEKILSAFANGEADILVGTQMIVKGHDFPNVTLVGVLAADMSLFAGDYRATERTFQLITQAAGRAGRGELPGEVVIQTYQPEHYCVQAAAAQDYHSFYKQELAYRRLMKYPPVWNMLVILITSEQESMVIKAAEQIGELLKPKANKSLRMIGPTEPSIARINDIYRRVIYLKTDDYQALIQCKDMVEQYMEKYPDQKDVSLQFDFNPMNGF